MNSLLIRCSTFLLAFAVLAVMSSAAQAKNEKVTICHIPPGNPDAAHEITISLNAWPAHRRHGDNLGDCPEPPPDDDDGEDGGNGGGGNAGGGGSGGGNDSGGNGGGGGASSGGDDFAIVLCGERSDGKGRRIEVSNVGRVMVQETECQ